MKISPASKTLLKALLRSLATTVADATYGLAAPLPRTAPTVVTAKWFFLPHAETLVVDDSPYPHTVPPDQYLEGTLYDIAYTLYEMDGDIFGDILVLPRFLEDKAVLLGRDANGDPLDNPPADPAPPKPIPPNPKDQN